MISNKSDKAEDIIKDNVGYEADAVALKFDDGEDSVHTIDKASHSLEEDVLLCSMEANKEPMDPFAGVGFDDSLGSDFKAKADHCGVIDLNLIDNVSFIGTVSILLSLSYTFCCFSLSIITYIILVCLLSLSF